MKTRKMKAPKLRKADQTNFRTLERAWDNGAVALVSVIRKSDRQPVALICAIQHNADDTLTPVPFAVMIEGNPFEMFDDPTQ